MNLKNDLLLKAANGEQVPRPPIWLMRQAGRILPQYRALRNKLSGFKELVETPDLAAEVTIQPVDELGVDAAIIFSDILVIPEAMGLPYELIEKKGPLFNQTIKSLKDVENLKQGVEAASQLSYVYKALEITQQELDGQVPLIGFAGAPWTIMAYMVEGSGSKTFSKAKKMLYQQPELSHQLLNKITNTTIAYLKSKIDHGADIIQIFDSWAGILSPDLYKNFAFPYMKKIIGEIDTVPIIVFPKGAWYVLSEFAKLKPDVIGLDWNTSPNYARQVLGKKQVVQGNLDPCCLYAPHEIINKNALQMLREFDGNHIVNLGHGVYPDTPLDNVKYFVDTVKSYSYSNF